MVNWFNGFFNTDATSLMTSETKADLSSDIKFVGKYESPSKISMFSFAAADAERQLSGNASK